MAVTVCVVLSVALVGIWHTAPWWVCVWVALFMGGAIYIAVHTE